ncbi:MAG: hypothetical protein EBS05_09645 [Proteobacteria bacterium]|nr:hypothetical protein [Pseudomonadota bacterium]
MRGFLRRRLLWSSLLVAASITVASMSGAVAGATARAAYLSGWLLFGIMVLLTGYNWFKKIPYLPLGRSEVWLEFHLYAGVFTGVLFLLHVRFRLPTGWFEAVLAGLYALVMLSGVLGIIISRGWPKRLTARGGEVPFERIPIVSRQLREQAEALALNSVAEAKSATIAEFYTRRLHGFFAGPQNLFSHLFEIRLPLNALLDDLDDLNRFLDEPERKVVEQLVVLVRQKDGLDYQRALQLTLRLWLFVHIPVTYSLMLWAIAHIVLVYGFSAGAR